MRDAIIVGGGIGGLTAALFLHRAGVRVRVFEAAAEIRALGVGINLLPHSVKQLSELGLLAKLEATAIETAALSYYNRHGQVIWSEPRGLAAGYAFPQFSVHRGDLQMVLLRAAEAELGAAAIVRGHSLEEFSQSGSTVTARFRVRETDELSERHEADFLIGADGIHSVVRRTFYPDEGAPRYSGRMLWRAVSETPTFLDGRTMIMAGHQDQKFVCYPISRRHLDRGQSLTNWIAELSLPGSTPPRSDWNRAVAHDIFSARFDSWKFAWLDVPTVIRAAEAIYEFPMVDRDPLPRWTFGRVTLLGDAAHPMYPIGSNGASQGILDARVLADAVSRHEHVTAALQAYETERLPRTSEIVRLNRQNGPEQVMQLAEERAPHGFTNIEDVIPGAELKAVADRYKQIAGFDLRSVGLASDSATRP